MPTNTQENMKPSKEAFKIIKMWENCRLIAYKATKNEKYFTIGYGHSGEDVKKCMVISLASAENLLNRDVLSYTELLDAWAPNLTQRQFDALTSTIYNIGWYNFRNSTLGTLARNIGQMGITEIDVTRRMILWVRQGTKVLYGLQRRRVYEANYFLGQEKYFIKDGEILESKV